MNLPSRKSFADSFDDVEMPHRGVRSAPSIPKCVYRAWRAPLPWLISISLGYETATFNTSPSFWRQRVANHTGASWNSRSRCFCRRYSFVSVSSYDLRRGSVAYRYRHRAPLRGGWIALSNVSPHLWRSCSHRRLAYIFCRRPICAHHPCFMVLAGSLVSASLCPGFLGTRSYDFVCGLPETPEHLTNR